jgi:hypothetical protein
MFEDLLADANSQAKGLFLRDLSRNLRRERLPEPLPIAQMHETLAQHTIAVLNVLRAFFASVMLNEDEAVIGEALRDTVRDYLP